MRLAQNFSQPVLAAGVVRFSHDNHNPTAHRGTFAEHGDAFRHRVIQKRVVHAERQMFNRVLHAVGIGGEFLAQIDCTVVADHCRFRSERHDSFGEHNSRMPNGREHGRDVRARFHYHHDRKRIAAYIKVIDLLLRAIVVDAEILLLQVEDHFALGIAHGHRRRHFIHAHTDCVLQLLRGRHRLGLRPRLGMQRTGGSFLAARA